MSVPWFWDQELFQLKTQFYPLLNASGLGLRPEPEGFPMPQEAWLSVKFLLWLR